MINNNPDSRVLWGVAVKDQPAHSTDESNEIEEDMVEYFAETWVDPSERDYPE